MEEIKKFLKMEGEKVYLAKKNGARKRFENILRDFLERYTIKLKQRRFLADGQYRWAASPMGKYQDECWIYGQLSLENQAQSLIFEVLHTYFLDEGRIDIGEQQIAEFSKIIWQNQNCQRMAREALSSLVKKERRKK